MALRYFLRVMGARESNEKALVTIDWEAVPANGVWDIRDEEGDFFHHRFGFERRLINASGYKIWHGKSGLGRSIVCSIILEYRRSGNGAIDPYRAKPLRPSRA